MEPPGASPGTVSSSGRRVRFRMGRAAPCRPVRIGSRMCVEMQMPLRPASALEREALAGLEPCHQIGDRCGPRGCARGTPRAQSRHPLPGPTQGVLRPPRSLPAAPSRGRRRGWTASCIRQRSRRWAGRREPLWTGPGDLATSLRPLGAGASASMQRPGRMGSGTTHEGGSMDRPSGLALLAACSTTGSSERAQKRYEDARIVCLFNHG